MKSYSLTVELHLKLPDWNTEGADGISGVGVKSVDITRNTESESDLLGSY